jgi:hypothetical protein
MFYHPRFYSRLNIPTPTIVEEIEAVALNFFDEDNIIDAKEVYGIEINPNSLENIGRYWYDFLHLTRKHFPLAQPIVDAYIENFIEHGAYISAARLIAAYKL